MTTEEGIKNPVGLSGVRMQAKVHLITCHNDMAKNIVKAVERCGLKVDQLIFAGLAASYSVLTEDERELGVCVVDIGGGTMDMAVYTGGALRHTKVIPYAGNVVTSDIATLLVRHRAMQKRLKYATAVRWGLSLVKMRALRCRAWVAVRRVACSARRWQR